MKKNYLSPEFDVTVLSAKDDILSGSFDLSVDNEVDIDGGSLYL